LDTLLTVEQAAERLGTSARTRLSIGTPIDRGNLAAETNAHRFSEAGGTGIVLRFGCSTGRVPPTASSAAPSQRAGGLDRHRNSAQQPHSGVGSHHRPLRDPSASGPGPCRHLPGPTMRTARGRDCTSAGSAEHADDAGRSSDHWMVRVDVDQERGHPCTAPPARSCAEPPPSHQPPAPAATVSHRTPVWRPCAA
jgi:hypothetical protein